MSTNPAVKGQAGLALAVIAQKPQLWFRDIEIDERDKASLSAGAVPWLDYTTTVANASFLRKIVRKESGFCESISADDGSIT